MKFDYKGFSKRKMRELCHFEGNDKLTTITSKNVNFCTIKTVLSSSSSTSSLKFEADR